ncbi:7TM diverse intracellular signaling domain-containing protein [Iodobacter sp. CM08]|uniref:hybrid sensor histidine kinase/response regulator n=1 Tax=Iodobacter sp. CM08 TaxID=3085902 RepID=UPI002981CF01|nr:7TM diverse intracellular signaling domain-containing protein [Iodobacter sp. CM08]MDW5417866.1 7TM diverse intracellular signaling domain-containing protein [Iodobacter sp. CM08]
MLIACPSHALTINSQLPGVQLEQELKIWQDPSRKMSVNEVTVQRDLGRFQAQKSARHSLGYSRNAVWFSFVLNNPSSADIVNYVEYTEAQIASVSLYTRSAGESWQVQHFHAAQSAESRPLATIRPVFLQKIPAHTQVEVLMRVIYSDQEDMAGPIISDVRIWGEQNFIHANNEEMLLWGGMAGIMLLVAFAALAVFFASKDKTFLFYGLNLLTLTLAHLSAIGVLPLFLWQGQYSLTLLYVLSGLYYICAAQFARQYLKTAQITPKLDIALKGIIGCGAISAFSALLGFTQFTLLVLEIGGVGFMLNIVASLYAVRYGVSGAKLFALAWAIYAVSITVTWGLRGTGVIDHTPLTYRFNSVGIVIEILLFSAAMALRVAEINRQKEHLEMVYRQQLEKEASELEALVMQRTYELDLARRDAEAASLAKGNFLAHVSHEIRTPLTSILGYVDRLKHDESLNPLQMQSLARIADSGDYLLSLIGNVLNVSRLEVGLAELDESPISIEILTRQLNALFDEQAKVKHIALEVHSDVQGELLLDAGKLRQILVNLLGNAIKFTEAGLVRLNISLQQIEEKYWLIAEVSDTGPGIADADCKKIFAPFEQTLQGKRAGGAGLGLSISKDFALLMGGNLHVESTLGQGAIFTLCVPVKIKPVSSCQATLAIPNKIRLDGQHILIAEDQAINRELLNDLLISTGAKVTAVEDGLSALNAWRCDSSIATVLLDYHMPLLNGMQVSRSLRALGFKGQVLLLSAGHSPQADTLQAAGIDQWIEKPFHRETLFAALQNQARLPTPPTAEQEILDLEAACQALAYSLEKCVNMAQKGLDRISQLLEAIPAESNLENKSRHAHSARGIAGQIGAHQLSTSLGRLESQPDNQQLHIQAIACTQAAFIALQAWRQQLLK